jgi:hypothetical protein
MTGYIDSAAAGQAALTANRDANKAKKAQNAVAKALYSTAVAKAIAAGEEPPGKPKRSTPKAIKKNAPSVLHAGKSHQQTPILTHPSTPPSQSIYSNRSLV